jgi:ABC-type spermidine/putrescine transport system permease subunit I
MQQTEIGRQPVRSVAAGTGGLRRLLRPRGVWLLVPNWLWAGLFFVLPLCIIVVYSFLPIDANGNATPGFTGDNYAQLNDPLYIHIFW